jgi:hypothetical protein
MSESFSGDGLVAGQARIAAAIDWQNCIICQKHVPSQSLVCPALGKKRQTGDGYKTLEDDLLGFQSIGCLPQTINMDSLNEGSGISNTLKTHFARWHKSCRGNINSTKLDRAKKRKLNEEVAESANLTYECSDSEHVASKSSLSTRSCSIFKTTSEKNPSCFFCDQSDELAQGEKDRLWQVRTFSVDARVRQCAAVSQDFSMLAKLSKGDMIAVEAHYHARCLVSYYKRANRLLCSESKSESSFDIEGVVLGELVAYIEDIRSNQSIAPVFKLSDLKKMYLSKLRSFGIMSESRVNST